MVLILPLRGQDFDLLAMAGRKSAATPPSSLMTNQVAYWRLDENSGTRYDVVGTNNLASVNNTPATSGIITNAALFTDTSNHSLDGIDSPEVSITTNTEFTIAGWCKFATTNAVREVVVKGSSGSTAGEYWVYHRTGTWKIRFGMSSGAAIASLDAAATTVANSNYFFAAWRTGGINYLRINDSVTKAAWANAPTNGVNNWKIGNGSMDGWVDEVGIWKGRALSTNELDTLFNSGAGKTYPFLP